ncbi:hypothetical protein A2803_04120 [Candidatus Woesebacteria bacterium RIFCSPHIGHO2_01_FULL_44_21]|uniref:Nudix hydrolase domain-containing protein n=1 Tax=Candidatus Woesebacteria bacterium RIFCSPHIGHO2_01_FULL_44_21 TaxID=1802503 RepID=A0A1F7YY81_9BACT|nr:MAG: hypothetical protein A2803_04120 [Candidatus Woesebacteria bacterium RIFCSPHIGHO2_01_FULL_44_21]OGM69463.1 MAG: hypothetical protein A2897_03870 [Candidatus Woesebacteria bacterium RIFCSPLOWO2_01_FULL_44_24b]
MKQLHEIQLQILKKLLFANGLKFSELKPDNEMENNQFTFHLDQMIAMGHIAKTEHKYFLTQKGKEFANRMDTNKTAIPLQAKISVIIIPMKGKPKNRVFLIYTRLKQPFYGCQGFMSGKVNFGEKVIDAAKREFKEETNLDGRAQIVALKHYRVFDKKTKELLEDKFMFYCKVENPRGDLVPADEGKYGWVNRKDLKKYVTNHFESFDVLLEDIKLAESFDGHVKFIEIDHFSIKF